MVLLWKGPWVPGHALIHAPSVCAHVAWPWNLCVFGVRLWGLSLCFIPSHSCLPSPQVAWRWAEPLHGRFCL